MPKLIGLLLIASCAFSCRTYYEVNQEFNQNFEQGNLEEAVKVLDANKGKAKKARFLYYANQGVVNSMLGNLEESNEWLEKAYLFGEDYQKNYANEAASFLVNPNTIVYSGEDHELLLLLYYKALNHLKLRDYESALIECRRLINRLNELSDKYRSENKYKRDAFAHNLMGIIYEASGDINNAFVAYRNALDIYESDYQELFGLEAPVQLKSDLLRAAALNGYTSDLDFYERKFNMKYRPAASQSELVFFWHNGLGPVKDEWSINFTAVAGEAGYVTFVNDEFDLSFPFPVSDDDQRSELTDLRFFRVAFPKYVEREPYFNRAVLINGQKRYGLEMAEDVNAIAFKTLEERMLKELSKGLLRAATKKLVEMAVRGDQSGDDDEKSEEELREEAIREGLSFLVGIFNAATEKADTRNWQTLPHSIYYTRVPLEIGNNEITLQTVGQNGASYQERFTFDVQKNETVFHSFQSLESLYR